jgi:hypothetical protein
VKTMTDLPETAKFPGIPGELRQRLQKALLSCEIFDSNARLVAIFVDTRLYPWRNAVHQADSKVDRVAKAIDYLHNRYDVRRQNALVLFIKVLSEEFDLQDEQRSQLEALSKDLEQTFSLPEGELFQGGEPSFPFTNREAEIRQLLGPNAPQYAIIDAPAGYGKTELLQRLASEFKARNWLYGYVKVTQPNTSDKLVDTLADTLGAAHYIIEDVPILHRLGSTLNRRWQSLMQTQKPPEGIVLLVDFDKKPELSLVRQLVNELLPATYENLQRLRDFQEKRNFRVIIAGRYLVSSPEVQTDRIPFKPYLLTPFDFKTIRDSVKIYLTNRCREQEILQVAAHAFYMTGGHPSCIAKIVEMYSNMGLPVERFLALRKTEIAKIVRTTVDEVLQELPPKYSYLHDERATLSHLSVFRYMDTPVLDEIVSTRRITEVKDGYGLGDELKSTYLFNRASTLIHDDIVRRLLVIQWYNERPTEFVAACRHAQDICAQRIMTSPRQPELWAIEYLFQALQQHAPKIGDANKRKEITQMFFEQVVPDMLQKFTQITYPQSLREKRDLLLDRLRPTLLQQYDYEFEYVVNYYLRESQYTDEPYEKLIRQIEDYFEKGGTR